jgi:hypothetical protein
MGAPASADLDRDLRAYFALGLDAPADDRGFDELALRVFAWQYEALAPYRAWCQKRGALPTRIRSWTEIPAVPAQAFRDVRLWCDDDDAPAAVFRTSGTTAGARPGQHYMSASGLALYDASLTPTFRGYVLPELAPGAGARSVLALLALGPPPAEAPHSSLWHMVDTAGRALFERPARWFMTGSGLDVAGLEAALTAGDPLCLVTTDLALDSFLAGARARGFRTGLPGGSRLVHTGGGKGLRRSIQVAALYDGVSEILGLEAKDIVNEYGMTELASQFYDDTLRRPGRTPLDPANRLKHGPPWLRTQVVDVQTLEPLPPGRPGLLRFFDLANRGSVLAVQSEDRAVAATDEELGRTPANGARPFRLLGRAQGSEPRGCSLDAEEALA